MKHPEIKNKYPKYYIKRIWDEKDNTRVWIIESPDRVRCKSDGYDFELKNIKESAFVGNDYVKEIQEQEAVLLL